MLTKGPHSCRGLLHVRRSTRSNGAYEDPHVAVYWRPGMDGEIRVSPARILSAILCCSFVSSLGTAASLQFSLFVLYQRAEGIVMNAAKINACKHRSCFLTTPKRVTQALREQADYARQGVHMVIATPGRLQHLLNSKYGVWTCLRGFFEMW